VATKRRLNRPRRRAVRAQYDRAVTVLARVVARWVKEDGGGTLDAHLTQIAEDVEALVTEENDE